jgi:hypothetical protein
MVFGEIVYVHVFDDVYDFRTGRIGISRLRPAGHLAANEYAHVHDPLREEVSEQARQGLISLSGP